MQTIGDVRAMQRFADQARAHGRRIGLVPTMGYLHEGHRSLVRLAREQCDDLVVSIFVNPTQFNSAADLEHYPSDPDGDRAMLEAERTDVLFAPDAAAMYAEGHQTVVRVEKLAEPLCGAHRPGHFDGVATVVTKLLTATKPHVAVFGEKDAQQLLVIRRLVRDLGLDVEIVGAPIVREADGLAMSSRNARLSGAERSVASAIPKAMGGVTAAYQAGERSAGALIEAFTGAVEQGGGRVEYAEMRLRETLELVDPLDHRECLFAVAVWVGDVRLIDNALLGNATVPSC